ncbi:hypothetical protein [Cupriavidus plantarum]|uniref:hypothetical protein n=1 Tax=Cupriavidus plantarum TaxID=942865 RepID=UPI001B2D5720|nr:hypothetical protein [Cupriavidus plantarum]CAG2139728.1 hypothetical protein LMG26296_02916 [Cupriavidus plantarum]SMR85679.1 hypothetical protein SAMN05421735_4487 [Cupriavidus plantarum]
MPDKLIQRYHRCYISAPFGLDLGRLPELLADRQISWEWAKSGVHERYDAMAGIKDADFALVVMNGTNADIHGAFDTGIAMGLGKPVFLIKTGAGPLPIDLNHLLIVESGLENADALGFHLDAFLATPPTPASPLATEDIERSKLQLWHRTTKLRLPQLHGDAGTALEKRVFDAVTAAGGSPISEPTHHAGNMLGSKFRPDFLAWLGHVEPELLNPVVIEVKIRFDPQRGRQLEEQLLTFMQASRLRMALVVTEVPPPHREQQLSPNILWLPIADFEALLSSGELGTYVRETRARIAHGAR